MRLSQELRALVSSVFVGSRLNRYGARLCYDPGSNWQYISQHRVPEYENRRLKTKALGFPRLVSIGTMMKQSGLASNLCVSDSFKCGPSKCRRKTNTSQNTRFRLWSQKSCSVQESWQECGNPVGKLTIPPDSYKS